jgi:hypothetical protein
MGNYHVDRSIGYRPWGVTNPWVFADLSQPQRLRGSVSRGVFMTNPPKLVHPHLGQDADPNAVREQKQEERAARMEKIAIIGLAISATSLVMFLHSAGAFKKLMPNRRRRRRRSRR